MKMFKSINGRTLVKAIVFCFLAIGCFYVSFAFAEGTLGSVAGNIRSSFSNVAKLVTSGAFLAGLGFAVGSVLKFKAHKDNAQSTPIGVPITLMIVAIALLFLPSIFKMGGQTVFRTTTGGTIAGTASISS